MKCSISCSDSKDPTQQLKRTISFQLMMKSRPHGPRDIQMLVCRAPGSDFQLEHVTYLHRFSAEALETPVFHLPLTSHAEVNRFIASKFVHLRVYFFEMNQDDRRRARDPRAPWWTFLTLVTLVNTFNFLFNKNTTISRFASELLTYPSATKMGPRGTNRNPLCGNVRLSRRCSYMLFNVIAYISFFSDPFSPQEEISTQFHTFRYNIAYFKINFVFYSWCNKKALNILLRFF